MAPQHIFFNANIKHTSFPSDNYKPIDWTWSCATRKHSCGMKQVVQYPYKNVLKYYLHVCCMREHVAVGGYTTLQQRTCLK